MDNLIPIGIEKSPPKDKDWRWYLRAQNSIAHGALTNSKRAETFVKGVYQTHLTHGQGPFVWDVEGHKLYDFICGLGSTLVGHGDLPMAQAIFQQAARGTNLSLPSIYEVLLAEKLKEMFLFVDLWRFLKTGSEACAAAVRIARAYTKRDIVLSHAYHGWHDEFTSLTPPAHGVPPQNSIRTLKDLNQIDETVAAVIIEPVITEFDKERVEFLLKLKDQCQKTGTLLIFDEIITGLRFKNHAVSNCTGIEPDLICLGKALGGGLPLSAVGGKAAVMGTDYFVSSTFAGEGCSIAAALELLTRLQKKILNVEDLCSEGNKFFNKFNELYPERIQLKGYGSRGVFEGDPIVKALFMQESYRAGLLFGPSFFIGFSHLPHLERIFSLVKDIINKIKTGSVTLDGNMPKVPQSQSMRSTQDEPRR